MRSEPYQLDFVTPGIIPLEASSAESDTRDLEAAYEGAAAAADEAAVDEAGQASVAR